ncbi:MAG TPA: hypothetical protein VJ898_12600 [Natrialbaceae archaeon]|nr:hypothetical protein [Natrialbaceae archaeon]
MDRRCIVLLGAGVALLAIAVERGALSLSYRFEFPGTLLRVGVAYLVLGVATSWYRPLSVRDGARSVLGAAVGVFAAGAVVTFYDLVLTPRGVESPLTAVSLVGTGMEALFLTLPVSMGFLAGVSVRNGNRQRAKEILLMGFVVGWIGSAFVVGLRGQFSGIYNAVLLLTSVASFGFGLLPLAVVGWMTAEADS